MSGRPEPDGFVTTNLADGELRCFDDLSVEEQLQKIEQLEQMLAQVLADRIRQYSRRYAAELSAN